MLKGLESFPSESRTLAPSLELDNIKLILPHGHRLFLGKANSSASLSIVETGADLGWPWVAWTSWLPLSTYAEQFRKQKRVCLQHSWCWIVQTNLEPLKNGIFNSPQGCKCEPPFFFFLFFSPSHWRIVEGGEISEMAKSVLSLCIM